MKVFIVGSRGHDQYGTMFRKQGWSIVTSIKAADLVQFTGGEDVNPELYGEPCHKMTGFNNDRDMFELLTFKVCMQEHKPMAGICRGGQFLNVANGGKMYQDVNNHAMYKGHQVYDLRDGTIFHATSTHHQMMRAGKLGEVIAIAHEATYKEWMEGTDEAPVEAGQYWTTADENKLGDIEVVWYEHTHSLCFQPHPEYAGEIDLANRYFSYINEFCFGKEE